MDCSKEVGEQTKMIDHEYGLNRIDSVGLRTDMRRTIREKKKEA